MKSLSLYEMTKEMMNLIEAAFGDITAKDTRICYFIRDLELAADARKVEEKRLADTRKALENKVKSLKNYIQTSMDMMDVEDLTAGVFKLKIQNNPPALKVVDPSLCPPEFQIVIPQTVVEDTAKIKDALKAGVAVPGYELSVGRSLRIR